jgi:hypothetical protein
MTGAFILSVIVVGIFGLCVITSCISLFFQKIYFDPNIMKPIEVEVPILGKVKSNYPAVIFLVVGVAGILTVVNIYKEPEIQPNKDWTISIEMRTPRGIPVDLRYCDINIAPSEPKITKRTENGQLEVIAKLPIGKKPEDLISFIKITGPNFSGEVKPKKEQQLKDLGRKTQLFEEGADYQEYRISTTEF